MDELQEIRIGRIKHFGISASIAMAIIILGLFLGIHLLFGFGVFMLALISVLTTVAVGEYVLALL